MMNSFELSPALLQRTIQQNVETALLEDVGTGDLTANLVASDLQADAKILGRVDFILCGTLWAEACFRRLDRQSQVDWLVKEGERIQENQVFCCIRGQAKAILTAERSALNFLQLLSGVATTASKFVEKVRGLKTQIVDTRKTIPGLRIAQKYAVTVGGGANQRIGLYDGVLIKENHIAMLGGVQSAIFYARKNTPPHIPLQIEVEDLQQLHLALETGIDLILLDNFDIPALQTAVLMNRESLKSAVLEVSGGVTIDTVRYVAETGVNRISIGALTKDIKAVDLSLLVS